MRSNLNVEEGQKSVFIDPRQNAERGWDNLDTSHSGHERNHLFLNTSKAGEPPHFLDVSGVSGLDSSADSRAMVLWDYDHDGWQDIAVAGANAPLLQFFESNLASTGAGADGRGRSIALRFVGGNPAAGPSEMSPRDGYGALVVADLGGLSLHREHRAGEGFAAQNSSTMLIGIGARESIQGLSIRWPSGNVTKTGTDGSTPLIAGSLVTAYEDASQSPTGEAFVVTPYLAGSRTAGARLRFAREALDGASPVATRAKLNLFTTLATTCAACVRELPDLAHLREVFSETEVAFYGLPTDEADTPAELATWLETHQPVYTLVENLSEADRAVVARILQEEIGLPDTLAASIVTDAAGRVLLTRIGPPSISELRRLLARL